MALGMAGVGVETLNLEVVTLEEVGEAISSSAGFVIGSPTLGGHMPTQATPLRFKKKKKKLKIIFKC